LANPIFALIVTSQTALPEYDVVIVGSGAGGGQAAYSLTMEGVKVLMLEAGRNYDPRTETPMFQENFRGPLRGAATPDKEFGFYDATVGGGWQVPGEPYTNLSSDPAKQFKWWRARMLGGRTNHWGRISLRNGPYDFKPYSRDGLGFDWPIGYADVAPYYDKVEMLIGVYGSNEGLENTPHSPDGVLLPPPAPRLGELFVRKHGRAMGLPVVPIHRAVLTARPDHTAIPKKLHPGNARAQALLAADMQKRSACYWATPCGRGCSIRANYQSTTVHLPPAMDSGCLHILPMAMAREVLVGEDGRATGILYIDKTSGREERVRAKAVVLAASACESVRLMLNSKSARHPNGLGNSTGLVGKYIMDTVGANFGGQIPAMEGLPPRNEDGAGGEHLYVPWWGYRNAEKLGFARGYHIEFGLERGMPNEGTAGGLEWLTGGTYGAKFKEDVRRYYGSFVGFSGRGEMIPNENSFCEIDPVVKDKWGIPVLRFHWEWSEHELRQAAHMQRTFADLIHAMGGRARQKPARHGGGAIFQGGYIIHEVGGARMGDDAGSSVTNQWGQLWDAPNVVLADGAPFCSNADKNPTLTIMALAWRSMEHLVESMRKGELQSS
jgi:choline dehydrogenase-like flavoprotein